MAPGHGCPASRASLGSFPTHVPSARAHPTDGTCVGHRSKAASLQVCALAFLPWMPQRISHVGSRFSLAQAIPRTGTVEYSVRFLSPVQSGLAPENLTTLTHFSVSSAMSLPKSVGEPARGIPPKSARRVFILGSARAALISLLILLTISSGVFL